MKKILPLLFVPLLALTSCGESVYGEYSFVLGKAEDDAHFGITLELMKLKYESKDKGIDAQRLFLDFDISEGMIPDPTTPLEEALFTLLNHIIDKGVNGYYWFNGNYEDKGTLVNMGILTDVITIDDNIVQKLFFSYLDEQRTMNFVMPCSFVDLQMQLAWYGYFIKIGGEDIINFDVLPELPQTTREDRIGTHPTDDDIDFMNDKYPDKFPNRSFRDYHPLTIPLKKEK